MGSKQLPVGSETVNVNGYRSVKVDVPGVPGRTAWRLVHHVVAEEKILGRPLLPTERVVFVDSRDRQNVHPDNLRVVERGTSSTKKRAAALADRIRELMAQYKDLTGEDYDG